MNEQVKHLKALTSEQRNIIKKLLHENRQLQLQNRALSKRNQDLEETSMVIEKEIAEIPIGFDLIPESGLSRY